MAPHWRVEKELLNQGYRYIAGVDEVGMGCLAGPVVAAAVIFKHPFDFPDIDDSKKLSPQKRERLLPEIKKYSLCYGYGEADVEEIDTLNIFHAGKLAMQRALVGLIENSGCTPDYVLVDGKFLITSWKLSPQKALIKGDSLSVSIASASVLAKVYRDKRMVDYDQRFPGYGFAQHKGYGSKGHREKIFQKGPTCIHRKSFTWSAV